MLKYIFKDRNLGGAWDSDQQLMSLASTQTSTLRPPLDRENMINKISPTVHSREDLHGLAMGSVVRSDYTTAYP